MTPSEEAFRQFHQQLRRYVQRRLSAIEDIEDVLQEVFLRVVRNEARYSDVKEPLAWLYTVTKSVLADHYRKQGKMPVQDNRDVESVGMPIEVADTSFSGCIVPLLADLPEIYREALRFTDLNGGRQKDFAASQGIGLPAAKSRIRRGREMLKKSILSHCAVQLDGQRRVMDVSPHSDGGKDCC